MGFWTWLFGLDGTLTGSNGKTVSCQDLFEAAAEYTIRDFAFHVCVDMVANAVGRCEFRTYIQGRETAGRENWLWNVEPNLNENSTVFLHKLINRLYRDGQALVVSFRRENGLDILGVADHWEVAEERVTTGNEYNKVSVNGYPFEKTFYESDVLRFRLNADNIRPVLDAMSGAWNRMANLARAYYEWDRGHHWKVHIDQIASGANGFEAEFAQMIKDQVKPFFEGANGVLPEFDGYKFEQIGASQSVVKSSSSSSDLRDLVADIFDFTSRAFLIPSVLTTGKVENTQDAYSRFLTIVIDPLCDQLQEEINRKRYGFEDWEKGNYLRVDSSSIIHYDLFGQAANVEKLVGSGVYSINDLLRAVGQGTINEPWADKHYLTKNIAEMGSETQALGE